MGRAEDRARKRSVQKMIGKEGTEKLLEEIKYEYVKDEVHRQCKHFREVMVKSTIEAMLRNDISETKVKIITRDIENIILRRCYEDGK